MGDLNMAEEKKCCICHYYEIRQDEYYTWGHCKLHNINTSDEPLEVCDDYTKSEWAGFKKVIAILNKLW